MDAVLAYVGLGSNLDGPEQQLHAAAVLIDTLARTRLVCCSSLYVSAPVGYAGQPDFANAVCAVHTALAARELLAGLQGIEQRRGRIRAGPPNGPRRIDLDLLLYGDATIHEPGLEVPHPRMHTRRFVLEPLAEICPHCAVAGRGAVRELLEACRDQRVRRLGSLDPVAAG